MIGRLTLAATIFAAVYLALIAAFETDRLVHPGEYAEWGRLTAMAAQWTPAALGLAA